MDRDKHESGSSFSSTQIGSITKHIQPITAFCTIDQIIEFLREEPELQAVPVEQNGEIIGILPRPALENIAGSPRNQFRKTTLEEYMQRPLKSVEAATYIGKIMDHELSRLSVNDPGWFVVLNNGQYHGIITVRQMLAYTNKLRMMDLTHAGEIQRYILSKNTSDDPRFDVFFYNKMAYEVGGDFYRIMRFADDFHVVACFDVAGKNLSGALTAAALGACFSVLRILNYTTAAAQEITDLINAMVRDVCPEGVFVTAVLFYIDLRSTTIEIHNCGFSPVYMFLPGEDNKIDCKVAHPNLPPLGVAETVTVDTHQIIPIASRLRIAAYSDGLTDMVNCSGERFGNERCFDLLKKIHTAETSKLPKYINQEIETWTNTASISDDITLAEIRFT
ncbi:PP2C family protein-serine/threonine phosphatase [Breznakiella homolactica]|uniref:SpoIIE family protein phosphatase n=1 Tax=Breznakiella homolactica TaxID=2798577 RepID=A0A7T8BAQ9_9SPIR|nr:SpoIIE family protein phosphatase [Breznakiella homolactica]QQO10999.1 SpoIIE family protein phosphatase [Breznakiella homolactica]